MSRSGDDAASGTSRGEPWQTLERVNQQSFGPGAKILLQGGQTFSGGLAFDEGDGGTPESPITVGSYGGSRATVEASDSTGIALSNTAGIRIVDLEVVGAGPGGRSGSGISATNDLPGDVKLPFLEIERVEVSGFPEYGVHVDGDNGKSGFRDVRVSHVRAHENVLGGIVVEGEFDSATEAYAHSDVYIGHSRAYGNLGVPAIPAHTGSGIVISDVDTATIEHSVAYANGRLASGEDGGPVGIWAWDARRIVIQHNRSFRNTVIGDSDGGGFDLDGGVRDSIVQFNDSHDNAGAGFLAVQFEHARPHTNNVIRHNTSRNDARKNGDGAIFLAAGVSDLEVYGNEVLTSARESGPVAAVAVSRLPGFAPPVTNDVRIYENRLEARDGAPLVRVTGAHPGLVFAENEYASTDGPLRIAWRGDVYRSLASWRAATGQELVGGPDEGRKGSGNDFAWLSLGLVTLGLAGVAALRSRRRRGGSDGRQELGPRERASLETARAHRAETAQRNAAAIAGGRAKGRANLNDATPAQLAALGLLDDEVQRVVEHRGRLGGFKSLADLDGLPIREVARTRLKRRSGLPAGVGRAQAGAANGQPAPKSKNSRDIDSETALATVRQKKAGRELWVETVPKILPYAKPYWRLLLGSVAMSILAALFTIAQPWPIALVIDDVLGQAQGGIAFLSDIAHSLVGDDRYWLLGFAIALVFALTALEGTTTLLSTYITTKLKLGMVLDFMSDLFEHLQRLGLTFHNKSQKGALMNRVNQAPAGLGEFVASAAPIAQSVLTLLGMLVVAALIDWQVALAALLIVPLLYYEIGLYNTRVIPQLRQTGMLEMRVMSTTHEAMQMLRLILSFGRERHEHSRFLNHARTANEARMKVTLKQTLFSFGVNAATAAGTAIVLGIGALHVIQGKISVGELVVLVTYVAAVYKPLQDLMTTVSTLNEQLVTLSFALEVLAEDPEIVESPDARPIERAQGRVTAEDVTFTYKRRKTTLDSISFEARPGERIAIVGQTGSGKSTLASLLIRFYDPDEGRILLDGADIRELTLRSLREQISVVLQEPLLLSGTIEDNILYGRLDASEEELIAAAKAANVHDFVSDLRDGYDTKLGERGPQLSGGEQQRICIARAFLKDAPILILDEPTSSVDAKTEGLIFDALDRLMQGRTSFVITHRLSTIQGSDRILVIDHGRLVAQGTHDELLADSELYRALYGVRAGRAQDARPDHPPPPPPAHSAPLPLPSRSTLPRQEPSDRIRSSLADEMELEVPVRELLANWKVSAPSQRDRRRIERDLARAEIQFDPSLVGLRDDELITLRLRSEHTRHIDAAVEEGWRAIRARLRDATRAGAGSRG